jgi:hypothetical protein
MSAAGVFADIIRNGRPDGQCLLIGPRIPRIHHSDGIPVYMVVEHHHGIELSTVSGLASLLAYPSAWPGPGARGECWLYAKHERLQWNALIPLHDGEANGG